MSIDLLTYHHLRSAITDLLQLADRHGLTDVSIRLDAAIVTLERVPIAASDAAVPDVEDRVLTDNRAPATVA